MPCIQTKTNVEIPPQTEKILKTEFGKAIGLLPGKSETWLMLSFEGDCHLYFQGSDKPAAFVNVDIYGKSDRASFDRLTASISTTLQKELSIDPARVYVRYGETDHWGWNGSNF